jgi:bacterial/archaeal transporter family-2 protein
MFETILTILIGLLGGISVGIQSPLAGAISQRVGGAAGSLIIHVSGAVFSLALLLMRGGENIRALNTLPWYLFGAGGFGLLLYLTLSHTLPRLGAGAALTLIIAGQLLMGLLIDQFGWFGAVVRPIDLTRILAVLLAGAYLLVR